MAIYIKGCTDQLTSKPASAALLTFSLCRDPSKILSKRNYQYRGIYTRGCSIPTGALFHFFLLLETHKKFVKIAFSSVAEKKEHYTRKVYMLMISEAVHSNYKPRIFFFRFIANSSACLRSSVLGLPLFIPPNSLRKLFVFQPTQLNSSTIIYPLHCSFSLSGE